MSPPPSASAALRGEPSYAWRAGQERRLKMIRAAAPMLAGSRVLVDGCGVGMYVHKLGQHIGDPARIVLQGGDGTLPLTRPSLCSANGQASLGGATSVHGLDIEFDRLAQPVAPLDFLVCGAGEYLPYPGDTFDVVLSHEVLEHVIDDAAAVREIIRVLRGGGRAVIFVPNRWYPVETHGVYWRGKYYFGNIPLVNYLPNVLRNWLTPHVRAYTRRGLRRLFDGLPVRILSHTVIYGGYDNLIARFGSLGRLLRAGLCRLENTPLQGLGLSHFLVVEKSSSCLAR